VVVVEINEKGRSLDSHGKTLKFYSVCNEREFEGF
jgi:hypothetical protein